MLTSSNYRTFFKYYVFCYPNLVLIQVDTVFNQLITYLEF